jgi:hypothetical protein
MTDAHDTPPAWLLQHARDTAQRLHDAGEPVTPDAVAEQMRLSFNPEQMRLSVKDTLDAARWQGAAAGGLRRAAA